MVLQSSVFPPKRRYTIVAVFSLIFPLLFLALVEQAGADVRESMVKIFTVETSPDYDNPWVLSSPGSSFGSGCVIAGNRILTNAHVVSDQTYLQVRSHGHSEKHDARVLAVSHVADLALITVDDESFFENAPPLAFGELPDVQQEVVVYGFPEGGDSLSTTQGVVSRIEHQYYAQSGVKLLAIQIDAAINSGNSGGPVMVDDAIVGVAMQSYTDADNIGYMVPNPIINHFLQDMEDGHYDGVPSLGITTQAMENAALKKRYGVSTDQSGVLVTNVVPGMPSASELEIGDVILAIDGHMVADDGTVEFRPNERTHMSYYVQRHQIGEQIDLDVFRSEKKTSTKITLTQPVTKGFLVPRRRYDTMPTYYIFGGLVFCPLTMNYLETWGDGDAPAYLRHLADKNWSTEGEEAVLLANVLPASVNTGYHDIYYWHITEVNGKKIDNLADLIGLVENDSDSRFVVFKNHENSVIVLDREQVEREETQILSTYGIESDRSVDLQ